MDVVTREVSAEPQARHDAEQLLTQVLGSRTGQLLPSFDDEDRLRGRLPGYPRVIVVGAFDDHGRLVGAGVAQAHRDATARLAEQAGISRAIRWATTVRLLSHLAVDAEHRGVGVGRAVVDQLEATAAESGARFLFGLAEVHDRPSAPFYRATGFTMLASGESLPPMGGIELGDESERVGQRFWRKL